ncbi:RIO1 family regulatory kinase/ATPase domain-containing protein [Ilumatobacter nonamiensis]|uniref:RIO1 family regulatory kinase/ATPase domain-containing protein n=1 Tax=Ilumatobacter nonamiensis TaxID=467093 RepID=UPI0003458EB6|nr:RIO1 family regulatory kinase/ATPase [Ilumatobacter nonamiensis]
MRSTPSWLVVEPWTDVDLGVIKVGKEAQVNLVHRTGADNRTCQFARKRYLPREVTFKGQLEQLGVQRSSAFVNDVQYREGRQFRKSRDRRAVAQMSTYGRRLLQDRWTGHEHEIMSRLWAAGMSVPYPIAYGDDVFDLEYIGDDAQAAPQLQAARLSRRDLGEAFDQLIVGLRILIAEGFAHGDLSAYNLLWWDDRLWFIDFPQAVDIAANLAGLDFVHRDVTNVCGWFQRKGLDADAEDTFADLLHFM